MFENESPMILKTNMTRLAAWTLAPLAAASLAIGVPAIAQSSNALASVQSHLKSTSSMTASFVQTDRNGQRLNGQLTLKRPGKIRFQYQKGVPLLIVGDGSSLTMIDYEVRQVQRWPVKNSPLAVLLNPKRDITKFAKLNPTSDPRVVSIEVHDSAHPEYGRITMIFQKNAAGPAGLMLQGWVALDSQNNRTTIRLTNQQINGNVSDGVFRWNDPRSQGPRNR